jgi:uncharacterized protein (DUF488 family)
MQQARRLTLPSASAARQQESRIAWNRERSREAADFFTIGYTGRPLSELLTTLLANGVMTLVDIRQNPVSMYRPELSRSNLARAVAERGINYLHLGDLGVPRDIRAKAITAGTRDVIWDWYDEHVAPRCAGRNLHRFFNAIEHPAAFMCVEIDPCECHRHRLSVALEAHGLRGFDL